MTEHTPTRSQFEKGAFAKEPPSWATDQFNEGTYIRCGICGAWETVVRPGKTQCDICYGGENIEWLLSDRDRLRESNAELLEALIRFRTAVSMGPLDIAAAYGPNAHPDIAIEDAARNAETVIAKATGEAA